MAKNSGCEKFTSSADIDDFLSSVPEPQARGEGAVSADLEEFFSHGVVTPEETLKRCFGFDSFREGQRGAVVSIMAGEELCCVMPTGYGKSLCYQLPSVARPGYAVVVSPLISLMVDQVAALEGRGVHAAFINSTQKPAEQAEVFRNVEDGKVKLLYVAPERFDSDNFISLAERLPPSMVTVDEAHCVSQWGHDFRPSYARLGETLEKLGIKQVQAFTATATARVRQDIAKMLRRPGMREMLHGFARPNLRFAVRSMKDRRAREDFFRHLPKGGGATIVYAPTRKGVDMLAQTIKGSIPYHAGMSDKDRMKAQARFMDDKNPVLVATCAFGMGIDRGDVRRVYHLGYPGSLESYYQEAGRAGRDGDDALCEMVVCSGDSFIHKFFMDIKFPPVQCLAKVWDYLRGEDGIYDAYPDKISDMTGVEPPKVTGCLNVLEHDGFLRKVMARMDRDGRRVVVEDSGREVTELDLEGLAERRCQDEARIRTMERYVASSKCRQREILEYFGDRSMEGSGCGSCDKCRP
jgi:ATP-dependent DNA helicase RecQ